jgi:dihydrofolate reductase
MRRLVVSEWVTVDGVFDGDTMDKWFNPFQSGGRAAHITEVVGACGALVFGRTTYEMLGPFWSAQKTDELGPAAKLNSVAKYVVSSTLTKADWHNSTIIKDDVVAALTALKRQPGHDILILGSAALVQSLMAADVIDEYRFLVQPIAMGGGKRFFKDGMATPKLDLLGAKTFEKGVVELHYKTAR